MKELTLSKENIIKTDLLVFISCLLLSFLFLLIATKSSPLYPFNDWADANISFTMGKGMMNGKIPYRDLFDHKGPLFYLLFGVAYLISNTTFLGVFIFEVMSFSFFLFFSYKLFSLYLDRQSTLIALPLLAASVLNLNSFVQGGSSEEFCLPLVTVGLYHLVAYYKDIYPKPMPKKWVIINGLIAGIVLWIKFSLLGFWFGWMLSLFICLLLQKGIFLAIKSSFYFLSGMFITTLPWMVYFGVHQSIREWINSYFVINFTSYSKDTSIVSIIPSTIIGILSHVIENPIASGFMIFGFIVFLGYRKYSSNGFIKSSLILCFAFLSLSVFGGGRNYVYYFLIFSTLMIFFYIVLFTILCEKFGRISAQNTLYVLFFTLIATFFYTLGFNHNIYMIDEEKGDLVQYKYASIINQTKNATLLNYYVLDLGFYTTTGIVPNIRFFHNPNIEYSKYPLIMDEQNRYIEEKLVDYIVFQIPTSYDYKTIEIPYLDENYELIEKEIQINEGTEFYYFLYEIREQ